MNPDSRLIVAQPRGQNVVLAIIFVIVVIVILVIVIILLRRQAAATSTSTGSGSTQCVNDVDCSGTKVCSTSRGICVDCISDQNCPINAPVCDQSNNKCVGCLTSSTCPLNKPHCDPVTKQCVQCTATADCGGATPHCNPATRTCVGCLSPSDCTPGAPICSPGTRTCVQCLTNAQCTAPATCVGGFCCDTTAPTITFISADITPPNSPHISGTYSFTQPPSGTTAVFQVLDNVGNLLLETAGGPANGTFSIYSPQLTTFPKFFSSYTYQVRIRLSQACGQTAFSSPASVAIPYTTGVTVPVIDSVSGNTGGFTVTLSSPTFAQTTFCAGYTETIWVIPDADGPGKDLNSVAHQDLTFCHGNPPGIGPKIDFSGNWPFPVSSGQKFWIRVTGQNSYENVTPSSPVPFTIP